MNLSLQEDIVSTVYQSIYGAIYDSDEVIDGLYDVVTIAVLAFCLPGMHGQHLDYHCYLAYIRFP